MKIIDKKIEIRRDESWKDGEVIEVASKKVNSSLKSNLI